MEPTNDKSYALIGEQVKRVYNAPYAARYRASDAADQMDGFHNQVIKRLTELTSSFNGGIDVLDVGCGTGRHFYGLKNVHSLTGVDISSDMIEEAKKPLHLELSAGFQKKFLVGNIFEMEFPQNSFDFAYSVGVLAEHSPLDGVLLKKVFRWLKPGGKFYFTAVNACSKWQRIIIDILLPILPSFIVKKLSYPRKSFYLFRWQLETLLKRSSFDVDFITLVHSNSPKWKGSHFEVLLSKK